MSKLRTITIDPQFLSISKKKQKSQKSNIPLSEVKLNSSNIRELLLEKLKQHKKNKKTLKNPFVQLNTIDENSIQNNLVNNNLNVNKLNANNLNANNLNANNLNANNLNANNLNANNLNNAIHNIENKELSNEIINSSQLNNDSQLNNEIENIIKPDKPYGILKNGNKPTYKSWTNINTIELPNINNTVNNTVEESIQDTPLIQKLEVKKVFNLGKNKKNKTVSVLLKNNTSRKKIEADKINLKKSNLSTVKNYLKKQNLIKFGTTAPNNLLREIYENTKLCGEIINDNTSSIIHNFKEE